MNDITENKVERLLTKDMVAHAIADEHPLMSEHNYNSFRNSIESYGQLDAVILYRGKIVDGRHRLRALTELGIEQIKVSHLPNNLQLQEVKELVLASEQRRHQTPTQLAIKGYDWYKSNKCTQREAADMAGCNVTNFKRVVQLEKMGRIDLINRLREGEEIDVSTDTRFNTMTDSLAAVVAMAKRAETRTQAEQIMYDEMYTAGNVAADCAVDNTKLEMLRLLLVDANENTIRQGIAMMYQAISSKTGVT